VGQPREVRGCIDSIVPKKQADTVRPPQPSREGQGRRYVGVSPSATNDGRRGKATDKRAKDVPILALDAATQGSTLLAEVVHERQTNLDGPWSIAAWWLVA